MKWNIRGFFRTLGISLVLFGCVSAQTSFSQEKSLYQEWVHSYEEDSPEVKVYRPSDYDFPFGWNREKMIIKEGGNITLYEIAPNDAMLKKDGSWRLNKGQLTITLLDETREPFVLTIIEFDSTILNIQK